MRILLVNKFNYPRGGAEKYFLLLKESLEKAGHQVAVFAMHHPKNQASPWKKYFVSRLSFNEGNLIDKLKVPGRMIYSLEAKRKFRQLLNDFQPQIIHCHNIYHQLSPSILPVAKKKKIPLIMHLHDYKLICPNYRLFTKGKFCQECLQKNNYCPSIKNNCYNSRVHSFLAYLEMTLHHKIWQIYKNNLDLLIAPSEYMRKLILKNGWPKEKVIKIINPAPTVKKYKTEEKNYLLYFGRLAPEKGIEDLILAARDSRHQLKLVGTGPLEKKITKEFKKEINSGQLKLTGQLSGKKLEQEIKEANAIIIPSRWPENMPLALLESLAYGKIIVASRIGGLPEIIQDKQNGFLFSPGKIKELTKQIKQLKGLKVSQKEKIKQRARQTARELNPQQHFYQIIKIYQKLAKKSD